MHDLLILAHAGEGATWQALVTMLSLGVVVVFLLVVVGRVTIEQPDDTLLPLAGVAVVAALAPSASDTLSDWIGWALPIGAAALLGILVHTFSGLRLRPFGPLAAAVVVVGAVAALLLHQPIVDAWHPPLVFTVDRDDATIEIVSPTDGDTPIAGPVVIEVTVTGATLLPGGVPPTLEVPSDPEEWAAIKVLVDGFPHLPQVREQCTPDAPCRTVTFDVLLDPGPHEVSVELLANTDVTFTQIIFDLVRFEVLPAP